MEPGHEVEAPATADETPLPMQVDTLTIPAQLPTAAEPPAGAAVPFVPTVVSVLRAIAATAGPWFPARFAAEAGVPRDSLDEPLAELRVAGLVRVAEWVRGVGQGYALTPDGEAAAVNPDAIAQGKPLPPPAPGERPEEDASGQPSDADAAFAPPIVVPALLMANCLWFFLCAVWGIRWGLTPARALSEGHRDVLHRFGAVSGEDLVNGDWWRLVSACFVHIGALHLIGNMFALAMMGPLAELLWGRGRLVLIYLISGLAGSALAMAIRPDSLLAGASGAIWGIQMSLFAWLFAFRSRLPPQLASDWFRRLSVVFALNAGLSFLPNVSWEGHLGGGAAGLVVAGLLNATRFGDRPRRVAAWVLLALLPVLCVAGLAAAMDAKGMPGWVQLRKRLADAREAREAIEQYQKVSAAQAEARKKVERDTREAIERHQKASAAQAEFKKEVEPRLAQVAPFTTLVVRPARRADAPEATLFLAPEAPALYLLAGTRRAPERVAATKAQVEALKATAEAVVQFTTREPTGVESFDRHRDRVRAFAAARARAFALLLPLLDAPGPPPAEAWEAWHAADRAAGAAWAALAAR